MAKTSLTIPYKFAGETKAVDNEVNANFEAVEIFSNGVNAELADLRQALTELHRKPTREMFDVYFNFSGIAPVGAYPLWTGETITNCRTIYPDFWKEALRLKRNNAIRTGTSEEYEKDIEEYGETGMFVIDELNGHLRLPKILHFISSISELAEKGKACKDAQQRVHGNFWTMNWQENYANSADGDFQIADQYGASIRTGDGGRWLGKKVSLDSNRSCRNGAYVQPRHVKLCLYLQVANNVADISMMDTNVIAEQLAQALAELEALYSRSLTTLETRENEINSNLIATTSTFNENAEEKMAEMSELSDALEARAGQIETLALEAKAASDEARLNAGASEEASNAAQSSAAVAKNSENAAFENVGKAEVFAAAAEDHKNQAQQYAEDAARYADLNKGVCIYSEEMSYAKGDWVKGAVDGGEYWLYESVISDNLGNALDNEEAWKKVDRGLMSICPSGRNEILKLGASGSIYTAPGDGWFFLEQGTVSGNRYGRLFNEQKCYAVNGITIGGLVNYALMLPVAKGEKVMVTYNADGGATFVFHYI